uniref:CMD domain-containing protein n=1 Tax=Steinernema glaseri TaxID=37863 RepID=A0A1I7YSW9_9BILA
MPLRVRSVLATLVNVAKQSADWTVDVSVFEIVDPKLPAAQTNELSPPRVTKGRNGPGSASRRDGRKNKSRRPHDAEIREMENRLCSDKNTAMPNLALVATCFHRTRREMSLSDVRDLVQTLGDTVVTSFFQVICLSTGYLIEQIQHNMGHTNNEESDVPNMHRGKNSDKTEDSL